ncbi:Anaphase-promoting complex subunit CDC26 [Blattella germanica]|nr:Anaphase-promoting complex subunit CDC26 [Blattella germanica]
MIRRSPTRIELKLDDIQEYESMRREQESRKEQQAAESHASSVESWAPGVTKSKQEIIHERIGYVPQPRMT